jgi:hypothetical protein
MLDWVEPGNVKHLNGAQDEGDYHPAHRPFLSLDEVAKVKGSGPLVSQENWQANFTIYSQGPIDLQYASFEVLSVLPGIGEPQAKRFLTVRRGPDGIDGTPDDKVFKDPAEFYTFLGLVPSQSQFLDGIIGFNDPTFHITSIGQSGKVYRQVDVVTQKMGGNPVILLWKEL